MKNPKKITIAIDGPAASGKSTTARQVARRLGYLYIDSGAMYRAVTLLALRRGIDVKDFPAVAQIAREADIRFAGDGFPGETRIYLNGEDVSREIRTPEIDRHISPVAANPQVREILVRKQQELGRQGGVVMDGRDIGTVVFPQAELKVFMLASAEERSRRRQKELAEKGIEVPFQEILREIERRDREDMNRRHGPLKKAPDALELDTTNLTIEEQVNRIIEWARERIDP